MYAGIQRYLGLYQHLHLMEKLEFITLSRYGVGENEFGAAPLRAPKWYKRPVEASFGFGGKLVGFRPRPSAAGVPAGASEVDVHTLVAEDSLVNQSSEFEAVIQNGERSLLRVLCEKKSQETESEDDRETWNLLKVMFEDDGTARTKLLSYLGFSVPTKEKDSVEDLYQEVKALELDDTVTEKVGYGDDKEVNVFPTDNGEDFFNNLSPAGMPVSTSRGENFAIGDTAPDSEQLQQEPDGFEESTDPAFDDAVQSALIVGDYKGAVAQCISANKMADALVIANVGGASLWESTQDQYLKISQPPYLKFAQREEWTMLCDTLALKLMTAGNTLAATLCYICARNIDKTVEIWSRSLRTEHEGKSYVELLQDLVEKTIALPWQLGRSDLVHLCVSLLKNMLKF